MFEQQFMDRVIALSREALHRPGTQPFGAVVVRHGAIVGEGLNHALAHNDPTSHGEVEAIRDACKRLGTVDLGDCELYAIGEPCPMCALAMMLAGIRHLYFGASHADATRAYQPFAGTPYQDIGVDQLQAQAGLPVEARSMPASRHDSQACARVYKEWAVATATRFNLPG